MDQQQFAACLVRLSRHKIGVMEAAALFSINGHVSNPTLSEVLGTDKVTTRSRCGVLRRKGLIRTVFEADGSVIHARTKRGNEIVNATFNPKNS